MAGFFDERLRGFVCERAAVQSAEFVLIQHMVKNRKGGGLGVCIRPAAFNVCRDYLLHMWVQCK